MSEAALKAVQDVRLRAQQECPYCSVVLNKSVQLDHMVELCGTRHESGDVSYRCSREKDHEGDHTACGVMWHPIRKWKL